MNLIVNIHPKARRDLAELAAYYGKDSVNTEMRFLENVYKSFHTLSKMPKIGVPRYNHYEHLANLRMLIVPHFEKIQIFYRALDNSIEVVRILHSSKDIESIMKDS